MSKILPESFDLLEIFETYNEAGESIASSTKLFKSTRDSQAKVINKAEHYKCKLAYIVGYYGGHYMSFALDNLGQWHLLNDSFLKVGYYIILKVFISSI